MKHINAVRTPDYVYILTNKNRTTLYIGVTSQLEGRLWEHKNHIFKSSFTDRYNLELLVHWEHYELIETAIEREKQLKKWSRAKKEALINNGNPDWVDLSQMIEW